LLTNSENLTIIEPSKELVTNLILLKFNNKLNFNIIHGFLSKKILYQKGLILSESPIGEKINIIENFPKCDTLIVDCEGFFYNILIDFPNILDDIKLLIIHNDTADINKYNYIKDFILNKSFKLICYEFADWGLNKEQFYQGWSKELV
jgi:hypothetical protein